MHRPRVASWLFTCALACALSLPAGRAAAWGGPAHRVVADIAEARLRPAARTEALRLLAGEPAAHLADVADWADDIRETGARDAGGHDASSTRRWHFVDFAGGCDYVPARDCPGGDCVIAAINHQSSVLGDRRRPDAERREALKYLVHLVADVHQPLHASPVKDKGGNEYQVAWHGKGRNLHAVWDGLVLYRAMSVSGLDADGYAASLVAQPALPPDPTARSDRPAVDWALESCRVVQGGGVYPDGHKIDDAWLDLRRAQADLQLRRAGERLGDLLDSALDPPMRAGGG
jgi:hypothetical protein